MQVVKALALGASAVLLGKPVFFSLAIGGEDGLRRMFDILDQELRSAMALCGCATLAAVRNAPDLACVRLGPGGGGGGGYDGGGGGAHVGGTIVRSAL